jgi:hypothetical protein
MVTCLQTPRRSTALTRRALVAAAAAALGLSLGGLAGCSDEPGHSKTVSKTTVETPTQKTTTTETHTKDTKVYPPP